jgi:hypothetical protein
LAKAADLKSAGSEMGLGGSSPPPSATRRASARSCDRAPAGFHRPWVLAAAPCAPPRSAARRASARSCDRAPAGFHRPWVLAAAPCAPPRSAARRASARSCDRAPAGFHRPWVLAAAPCAPPRSAAQRTSADPGTARRSWRLRVFISALQSPNRAADRPERWPSGRRRPLAKRLCG